VDDGDHLDGDDGTSCCWRNGIGSRKVVVAVVEDETRKHVGVAAETAVMGGGARRATRREATTRRRSALGRNGLKIIQI